MAEERETTRDAAVEGTADTVDGMRDRRQRLPDGAVDRDPQRRHHEAKARTAFDACELVAEHVEPAETVFD